MALSKSKEQKMTITIKDNKGKIDFKEHPTGFQLMAAKIILQARLAVKVYERIENVEEVEV